MRSIFIITMILFLFTACTAQPAAPTFAPIATLPPTSTLALTETVTPAQTPTLELIPTPEAPFNLNRSAEKIVGRPLTADDIKGPLAEWTMAQPECNNPNLDKSTTRAPIIFNAEEIRSIRTYALQPASNLIDNIYVQPKVSKICSYYKIGKDVFGFTGEDIFLLTQVTEDATGKLGVWQLVTGQKGVDYINQYHDPIPPNDVSPDDSTKMGMSEEFYTSQGTNRKEVLDAFKAFAQGGYNASFTGHYYIDKDGTTIEYKTVEEYIMSHVFRIGF